MDHETKFFSKPVSNSFFLAKSKSWLFWPELHFHLGLVDIDQSKKKGFSIRVANNLVGLGLDDKTNLFLDFFGSNYQLILNPEM